MPLVQLDALSTIIRNFPKLIKELEKANKLKALELKQKCTGKLDPAEVDAIVNN